MAEMYEKITTHSEDAKKRQVWQFENKQNFDDLIDIHASRIQILEDILWELLTLRAISTGSGIQLDLLAEILDLERNGKTDADFKAELFSSLSLKRKAGQVNVLIDTLKLLANNDNVVLIQAFPGHVIMHILVDDFTDIDDQDIIAKSMDKIKAGGINLDVGLQLNSGSFFFSDSLIGGGAGEGFATLLDGSDGGIFARMLEL